MRRPSSFLFALLLAPGAVTAQNAPPRFDLDVSTPMPDGRPGYCKPLEVERYLDARIAAFRRLFKDAPPSFADDIRRIEQSNAENLDFIKRLRNQATLDFADLEFPHRPRPVDMDTAGKIVDAYEKRCALNLF